MNLKGPNGKNADIVTAWIIDNAANEIRLASTYVTMKKRKGD